MEEKERLEIVTKKLEIKKKRLDLARHKNDVLLSDRRLALEQIKNIRDLITETVIDDEKTVFTTEPRYRLVFNEVEIEKLKKMIWKLLEI
jgi:hypothetical protein